MLTGGGQPQKTTLSPAPLASSRQREQRNQMRPSRRISPLYHVSRFDGPDAMSAVVQIETKLPAADLIAVLGSIEAAHELTVDLDLVDMEGVTSDEPNCSVPWPSARNHASVLAPWLDMDPDATLGGDPVSFLLAMAPDAGQVGLLSDNWVLPPQ